jgi:putative FmdB family regulatory protein
VPLYEYACHACEREFELLVRSDVTPACPRCGGTALTKLMSAAAIGRGGGDPPPAPGACGTCGDPRGPGACAMR